MPRQIKQTLPQPPPVYDQEYLARLAEAVNKYMFQAQALGEWTAARYIMTDPPLTTMGSPVGTLYLKNCATCGLVLSVVQVGDP